MAVYVLKPCPIKTAGPLVMPVCVCVCVFVCVWPCEHRVSIPQTQNHLRDIVHMYVGVFLLFIAVLTPSAQTQVKVSFTKLHSWYP